MAKHWMKIFIGHTSDTNEKLKWTATVNWQAPIQLESGLYSPGASFTGATVDEAIQKLLESEAFQEELRVMEGRDARPHEG